ncbi:MULTISPECIES: carbohydrate ABC transporter permease [Leifsonia]|uniref:ABC transporter, permease protein n=3 Tax=Leifsonia TaxID=110932 RepID=U2RW70_LEIAQ|nr:MULTISPECIES: sugar ABC transporter permease [Leifsonia]ERK72991.1 ABC transporter, permease protein [Leifsonia aquatica ATCC 14665]MBB2968611.1 multiple sugar transport system permease protein [Leifsonia aquatica]NYK10440.1 multiple sugar transport system permease protein [Leifsonia naganoensis]OJX73090.1 MAG: sugar ABC transporter permease [Leifsonia sp. 71-9]
MTALLPRAATRGRAPRPPRRRLRDDRRVAWLFIAPVLIGFAVFYLYPTIRGFWWSFTDYSLLGDPSFVGVDNYVAVLQDKEFWNSMGVTLYYVVVNVTTQTALALLLAALMHRLTRSVVLRTTLLLPWLVPNVTVGLIWLWLLDTNLGFVNHLITAMGLPAVGFFTSPALAIPTISVVNTWAFTGYTALLFYAGMLQIPGDLYESASLDGAGEWRLFTRITLPLLKPVMALVLVVSLIGSFQIFDTVAVTTKGGPVNATRVIYYYIYQQAFTFFHMGYAATMAIVLVIILGVLTAVQLRLLRASESQLA